MRERWEGGREERGVRERGRERERVLVYSVNHTGSLQDESVEGVWWGGGRSSTAHIREKERGSRERRWREGEREFLNFNRTGSPQDGEGEGGRGGGG